jgi:hypothetical protein
MAQRAKKGRKVSPELEKIPVLNAQYGEIA